MGVNRLLERCVRWRVPAGFAVGLVGLSLARPTGRTLWLGAFIAGLGEALRLWAAGHLERRELTASGPYRWVRHPLYLGSALMGIGFAVAANHLLVAALVGLYLAVGLSAAMHLEDAWLAERFGAAYTAYRAGRFTSPSRRFSLTRLRANREGRTLTGVLLVFAVLWWKMAA